MDQSSDIHQYCTGGYDLEDVVISGVAGRFPSCDCVGELKEALYNKQNLLIYSDERYEKVSKFPYNSVGLIRNIDKLDADYFCLNNETANGMDPMARVHLEVAYEALVDAGYDPCDLKGSKIGIYNATTCDDGLRLKLTSRFAVSVLHSTRTMIPNRSSYAFNFTGPSHTIDTACSSSAVALNNALNDLKEDRVEAALVTGTQLNMDPELLVGYVWAGIASLSGNSVPFDADSDGMLRTEGVTALFLQKAKNARRAYATIMSSIYATAGYVTEGISVPSYKTQVEISEKLLKETGLTSQDIDFIEGHGTGTQVGDPIEVNSMDAVYAKNRTKPVYMGTIKSNIGHTEASSGNCGVIKTVLAMETGYFAANMNYKCPNSNATALVEGRIIVPTQSVPLTSPYIPVNSFGFGGTCVVSMLKQNPKTYGKKPKASELPRLVLFPATTEEGINYMFDFIKKSPDLRAEFFALLNKLSYTTTALKPFRGYYLSPSVENPVRQIKKTSATKRQVWFVMTGMGCQWPGMGLQLMKIDAFAKSITKSAEALHPLGVDLFELLRADKNHFDGKGAVISSFVAIAAIQIALIDVMKLIGVKPDGIVGHSIGELVCAYADGCLDAELTIVSAYWRGKALEDSKLPKGAMAAVGLSWEQAQALCPDGIYAACNNSDDSVTVAGSPSDIEKFVNKLQKENIFATVVDSSGYAFHSKYIQVTRPKLKSALEKVIKNPKARTERWLSSSYPEGEWTTSASKVAGAEYLAHNLTSSVLFNDVIKKIPSDAITIEFGPHFLLQSILKRSIGSDAAYIGLMKRNEKDNLKFFFEALGKIYSEGLDPKIEHLYPPVQFPVPRGTPMISDLIKWNHATSYHVPKFSARTTEHTVDICPDAEHAYLMDHQIDGRPLFPATGYVVLAWEALANKQGKNYEEVAIMVENFKIHRATILHPTKKTEFRISILDTSGHFEILEGNALVASGEILELKDLVYIEEPPTYNCLDNSAVPGKEIYNELAINGYEHGPAFQGIVEINMEGTNGLVMWRDKWISFLDTLLLYFGLATDSRGFVLPTGAQSFKIDPVALKEFIGQPKTGEKTPPNNIPVTFNPDTKVVRSVGVEIINLIVDSAPHLDRKADPSIDHYKFISYVTNHKPAKDQQKQLTRYMLACNGMIDKVGKLLKKDVKQYKFAVTNGIEVPIEEYLNDASGKYRLLSGFKKISDNTRSIDNEKRRLASHFLDNIGKDLLNSALVNEDSLRIILDIISENTSRRLGVVEVHRNFPVILPTIMELFQDSKYTHMKFKKSVLVSCNENEVDKDVLDQSNIQMISSNDLKTLGGQDIAISSFTSGTVSELKSLLHSLSSVVKPNGFVLFFHKEKVLPAEKLLSSLYDSEVQVLSPAVLEKVIQDEKFIPISKISDPFGGSLYLLRTAAPVESHKILKMDDSSYTWVELLKKQLYAEKASNEILWLVSERNPTNGLIGMVNCLKQEQGGERIRSVFISQNAKEAKLPPFNFQHPFYKHLLEKNLMMNVWKNESWGSFRHCNVREKKQLKNVDHSYIRCKRYGDLSSFEWIESEVKFAKKDNLELVHIYYSPLNFKDVMLASGKISVGTEIAKSGSGDESVLGMEFCGRDSRGRRVCGFVQNRGMATSTLVDPRTIIEVPDNWTLAEAATVPVVYTTCYYALFMRADLERGDSILIHSGTGGIGMAAINIALSMDCEIFTTVGNEEKRKYLKKMFPQIKDENIGCSRDTSFETMIMNRTEGRGVDVILNSLSDEKFPATLRCVAMGGRFVEIGKYDLQLNRKMSLKIFLENISFHGVFLDELFDFSKPHIMREIEEVLTLVRNGIKSGVVKPLEKTVFAKNEVEEAFRYMAKGVHIGKILLKIRDEEEARNAIPKTLALPAIPATYFHPNKVYIIIGGLGGMGIELTKWILSRGGKNVILTSRYGVGTPYHQLCLKRWKKQGVNVQVSTHNAALKSDAEKLLQEASRIGPVGGIFNSAAVSKDAFMDCQTAEDYKEVCAPKATATAHLDELSRKMCPGLDYFVCFSSISCGIGYAGQTNYGYANSVMERICEGRREDGLHGLAVQWGIIGKVGMAHKHMGIDAAASGIVPQSVRSCLETLDTLIQGDCPVAASYVTTGRSQSTTEGDLLAQLGKIFGDDISGENGTRTLGSLGIDSILGVEMLHLIESHCDVSLSMQEVSNLTIDNVKQMLEEAERAISANSNIASSIATAQLKFPTKLLHETPIISIKPDGKGKPVFIVNIGDNDVLDFKTLSDEINRPTRALVWTKDSPSTDMKSLASWYLSKIKTTYLGNFHVIGHGLGGSVALEMALQNQNSDRTMETVILLDGSEDLVRSLSKEAEPSHPEIAAICSFVAQFVTGGTSKLEAELKKVANLEQRKEILINFVTASSSQSINKNQVLDALSQYFKKRNLVQSYVPTEKLSKDIHLIEDPTRVFANDVTTIKESLAQICKGRVNVHRVLSYSELANKSSVERLAAILQKII